MGKGGFLTILKTFFDEGTLENVVDIAYKTDTPKKPFFVRVAGEMVDNNYFSKTERRKFKKAAQIVEARGNSYRLESDRIRDTQIWILGLGYANTQVRHIRYVQHTPKDL